MPNEQLQILQRALERERKARKQAESILEQKAMELYEVNQKLKVSNASLEELTHKQSSQLDGVFDNLLDAYILMNLKGEVIEMNRSAKQLFGYNLDFEHVNVVKLIYREDYQYAMQSYWQLINKGYFKDYKARVITKNKEVKQVHINAGLVYDASGKAIAAQGIVRNITEEYKEAELKKALLANLEKSNQELKDFAHVVSHDLKSPLRSMNTLIYWLKEDYEAILDENAKEILAKLSTKVEKMDHLIRGVLAYSSIDKVEHPLEKVNIQDLVSDIISVIYIPENIKVEIPKTLPIITGDRFRLQQLFQNLLNNAVLYIDKPKGWVKVTCEELKTHWKFYIEDNGVGIDKKYQKKIFEVFQSLQKSDHSTGIGLSIVKKIIDYYEGEIDFTSTVGEGTCFHFTLKKKHN